jgi:hypothetical protein
MTHITERLRSKWSLKYRKRVNVSAETATCSLLYSLPFSIQANHYDHSFCKDTLDSCSSAFWTFCYRPLQLATANRILDYSVVVDCGEHREFLHRTHRRLDQSHLCCLQMLFFLLAGQPR